MLTGGFSTMEYLLVCAIVQYLLVEDWDWEEMQDIDAAEVSTVYHHVLQLTKLLKVNLALFERSPGNIVKLLRIIASKWEIFRQKNMVIKAFKNP